ncbi:MAG: hypothetical protein IJX27_00940 [Clostridia bacterium]|nr:hypothetical protein [Clostridia bacterium]
MKARYTGRRKRYKVKLWSTRDIINGVILLGGPVVLMILGLISENVLFSRFAFSIAFSFPAPIARHLYGEKNDGKDLYSVLIYIYAVCIWLFCFLPWKKVTYLISLSYSVACGAYLIYKVREFKTKNDESLNFWLLLISDVFMLLISMVFSVTTEINALGIILAVVGGAAITFAIVYFALRKAEMGLWKNVGYSVLIFVLAAMFCLSSAEKINWALDFSKPAEYSTRIREKEKHTGKNTRYLFTAYIDGKLVEFEVGADSYDKYAEGAGITVNVHRGALGMTYYTLKD